MFTKTARRVLLAALALTLCLLPAAAQAGTPPISRDKARSVAVRVQEGEGIFNLLWNRLAGVWQKEGASIDPSGSPKPGQTGSSDSGASIDPTGSGTPGGN